MERIYLTNYLSVPECQHPGEDGFVNKLSRPLEIFGSKPITVRVDQVCIEGGDPGTMFLLCSNICMPQISGNNFERILGIVQTGNPIDTFQMKTMANPGRYTHIEVWLRTLDLKSPTTPSGAGKPITGISLIVSFEYPL